ncbi:hypothetical protein [Cellulomonas triticagri]|uniref:Uncharacterized protein n=1 Tax=Cellulomonas triticagri TaxID=2483352 RepID=A0A3M2JMQ1_9CELL|nr:hypothetical protein [Cellulomonas triticagri]RMI13561.1 hypothetical protein EBM89_03895 [Cellulomonas triticagri]
MPALRSPLLGAWRRAPVLLVVQPSGTDLDTFPARAVEELRPPRARVAVGLTLGVVLAALVALLAQGADGAVLVVIGVGLAATALAGYLRGHPLTYVVGAAGGVVGAVAVGGSMVVAGTAAVVLLGLAWCAHLGSAARATWWPPLEALLADHRSVEGTLEVRGVAGSGFPHRYLITASSPDVPGSSWGVEEVSSKDLQPRTGDPVRIWWSPRHPEAAVLAVSSDRVGLAARLAESPGA